MEKKISIGLVYLNETNLGDIVIYDNVKYLLNQILEKLTVTPTFLELDIGNLTSKKYQLSDDDTKEILKNKEIVAKLQAKKTLSKNDKKKLSLATWHTSNFYYYLKNIILPKITKDLDVLIFVGGGLIKFKQQNFHYIITDIIKVAQDLKIPVVFNSVGVEGYDLQDVNCQMLKHAINSKCVKAISTRDDFDLLKNSYIENNKIKLVLTCDPALYSKECYNIKKQETSNIIGIGVIRPKIFEEYMYKVNEFGLLEIYKQIIDALLAKGLVVKVFTNGSNADYKFALSLKEYLKDEPKYQDLFLERFTTVQELVTFIASCKATIVTRLHAAIISYALEVPSVSLVWNNKQILFGEIIKRKNSFITKDNFTSDYILKMLSLELDEPIKINKDYQRTDYEFLEEVLKSIIKAQN